MCRCGCREARVSVGRMGPAGVGRSSLPVGFMVCKYYLPRYVCRVYAWLGCRVTESRVIRGGSKLGSRRWKQRKREKAEANSPSFYPILESECLAPLTLETGCTARSYTPPHFPLPTAYYYYSYSTLRFRHHLFLRQAIPF